jgi:hypothetical protein
MKKQKIFCVLITICMLSGCSSPKVYYRPVTTEDPGGAVKFKFAHSVIVFKAETDKSGNVVSYTTTSVPVSAAADKKYSIVGANMFENWLTDTTLNVTYRENSDLIQQIGVQITDKRTETIKTLASIATTAVGFVGLAEGPNNPSPPEQLDTTELLLKKLPECKEKDDGSIECLNLKDKKNSTWTIDVLIGPVPKDAIPATKLNNEYSSRSFLYSACREASISLHYNGKDSISGKRLVPTAVMIADPNWLETLRFPAKGKVIASASCGAESTAEDANLPNAIDLVNTLITQAKAVKDAYDKDQTPAKK